MKIWVHKGFGTLNPWLYWKPRWLNSVTWKPGDPKIYKWLWWGFTFYTEKKDVK